VNALTFSEFLAAFLFSVRVMRTEEPAPVPLDDPTRDPNWCWTHNQMYPACAQQHEQEQK
jgi:hypothetical protein